MAIIKICGSINIDLAFNKMVKLFGLFPPPSYHTYISAGHTAVYQENGCSCFNRMIITSGYILNCINSNTIESFWAIIERGIMGQYHSVSPKMLPNYVAEFVYKFNNRNDNEGMFHEMLFKLLKPINL